MSGDVQHIVILDDWDGICDTAPAVQKLRSRFKVSIFNHPLEPDALAEVIRDADVLIPFRERARIGATELAQANRLQLIAQTGGGAAHIDLAVVAALGATVTLTPGGSSPSVAELVIGMMLAHDHHIVRGDKMLRTGAWHAMLCRDSGTQRLGLLGFGSTARAVAGPAMALGMDVMAWSRSLTAADMPDGVSVAPSLEALLGQSDVLSIHLPLTDKTRGLMNAARFAQMKPGALVINTARGAIVDTDALITALERQHLRGACLDVFEPEPLPPEHPLRRRDDVILTPHVGWTSRDTIHRFLSTCAQNIEAFYAGDPINVLQT